MENLSLIGYGIIERAKELARELEALPEGERIEVINQIKLALHEVSPFHDEPVDCVLWVPADDITASQLPPAKAGGLQVRSVAVRENPL